MHSHLVAVEIGVKSGAYKGVDLDCLAFAEHRLKRLDAKAVERWGAIK